MELSSPEYYKLVCCDTDEILKINGIFVLLEYTGKSVNGHTPDSFFNKVIGEIKTLSKLKIKGCYILELVDADSCDFEDYTILAWSHTIAEAKAFKECYDCVPKAPIENKIYLKEFPIPESTDPQRHVFMDYAELAYRKMVKRFHGVDLCCPPNECKIHVNHKKLVYDRLTNKQTCCPPCIQVRFTAPVRTSGEFKYYDCEGILQTIAVNFPLALDVTVCACRSDFNQIVYSGTNQNQVQIIPLGIACS